MILLLIILIIILILFFLQSTKTTEPMYNFNQIKPYLKTGDILLFSCRRHHSLISRIEYFCRTKLLGSEYGHVGVVYLNGEDLWLYECTDMGHIGSEKSYWYNSYGIPSGLRVVHLDTVLRLYQKDYNGYFAVMYGSKAIPNDLFQSKLKIYSKAYFEDKFDLFRMAFVDMGISLEAAINLLNIKRPNATYKRLMCSEFVYDILYRCGAVKYYPSKLFWPHLYTNGTFNLLTNYPYTKPIAFTYE